MKQHRIRNTWQVLCVCAALHACSTNRSAAPEEDLNGTVIPGAGDTGEAGNPANGAHADANVGNTATGNATGTGGQPATTIDAGTPSTGSGGRDGMEPPRFSDGGLNTPDDDDDDDDARDAATDAGPDAGVDDDDDEYDDEAP